MSNTEIKPVICGHSNCICPFRFIPYICKMEKEFITYELALRMKQLGFDEECFYIKPLKEKTEFFYTPSDYDDFPEQKELEVGIPLFQQAFRWFRDNYNLYHNIDKHGYWFFEIKKDEGFGDLTKVISVYDFDRYEEAELACLIKLIEGVEKWS